MTTSNLKLSYQLPDSNDFAYPEKLADLKPAAGRITKALRELGATDTWIESIHVDGNIDSKGRFLSKSGDYDFADSSVILPLEVRLARIRWLIENVKTKEASLYLEMHKHYIASEKRLMTQALMENLWLLTDESDISAASKILESIRVTAKNADSAAAGRTRSSDEKAKVYRETLRTLIKEIDSGAYKGRSIKKWDRLLEEANSRLPLGAQKVDLKTFKKYVAPLHETEGCPFYEHPLLLAVKERGRTENE